jgi:hypothetical protein
MLVSKELSKHNLDLWEMEWGSVEWIDLAQDRERWRTLVKEVVNFRVP